MPRRYSSRIRLLPRSTIPFLFALLSQPGTNALSSAYQFTYKRTVHLSPSQMSAQTCNDIDPIVQLGLPSPIILGSGSFTRKLILSEMGIPYHLMVRPIDEKALGDRSGSASELVMMLAKAKGDFLVEGLMNEEDDLNLSSISRRNKNTSDPSKEINGYIILTADQVVTHDGVILEKPESLEEAKTFVAGYARSPPRTVGACVLTHIPTKIQVAGVDSAQINFRPTVADGDLIDRLVNDGAPVMSCAGGLMVEHPLVKEHIDFIDGTEDSVMGLSKELVMTLLYQMKEKLKA